MDLEGAFVSKVVADGAVVSAIEAQVTADFFEDRVNARVWSWIVNYWNEYGTSPTPAAFLRNYPAYDLLEVKEPFAYLLDELRAVRKHTLFQEAVLNAANALNDEDAKAPVDDAMGIVSAALDKINTSVSSLRDIDMIDTWEQRMDVYKMYRDNPGTLRGITTGFGGLDRLTSGFQPEQLVTLVGAPKAGKSATLIVMAKAAHNAGKVPLFAGFEMANEEQMARSDGMSAGVDYRKLLNGTLSRVEMIRLEKELKKRRNMQPFILSSDINSATTVSGLSAKISQYKPDIVFVDGAYLMDAEDVKADKGSPQYITQVTRSLKRMAQRHRIPVVITTQVLLWKINKKRGVDEGSIGYSSSFGQDSDLVIAVDTVLGDDGMPSDYERKLKVLLSRSGPRGELRVRWDWAHGSFEEMPDTYEEGEDVSDDDETFNFAAFQGRG